MVEQIRLRDGVDLRAVELWPQDRELIGADVEILLIDAQARLVAKARAAWMVGRAVGPVVRRVEVIDRPRRGRIARGVDRDVGARMVGEFNARPSTVLMKRMTAYQVCVEGS